MFKGGELKMHNYFGQLMILMSFPLTDLENRMNALQTLIQPKFESARQTFVRSPFISWER